VENKMDENMKELKKMMDGNKKELQKYMNEMHKSIEAMLLQRIPKRIWKS
jgi:hypothetical protein